MSALTPTTKLEAINTMLSMQGEEPYNSIDGEVTAEVRAAEGVLDEITKRTLSHGWLFNTEEDYPLTAVSNVFTLPTNAINVSFPLHTKKRYTTRGGKIYDREKQTFTITVSPFKVDLVWLLPFSDLPEVARRYITIRAAREYADRYLSAENVHMFSQQEEFDALSQLHEQEAVERDASILDSADIHTGVLGMRQSLGGWGMA